MSDQLPSWTFYNIWNESLLQEETRPPKERDLIWASELGGAYIDRYLKMNGTPYSNPPNPRSRRKFEAGNIWEWLLKLVLKRAGILQEAPAQKDIFGGEKKKPGTWCSFQYDNLFRVTGYLDTMAGGNPDWEKAKNEVLSLELPPIFTVATDKIISHFKEKYKDGLKQIILEIKTCSSYMFDLYERAGTATPAHRLQLFHYLKAKGMEEGHIVYICKDDARMIEIGIYNPSVLEDHYKKDIEEITGYVRSNTRPPLEKPIIFSQDFGRFTINYKVGYSNYLTTLYGLKDQFEFDTTYRSKIERWNRVLGRVVREDKMTDNNKQILEEIAKEHNLDEIVAVAKKLKTVVGEVRTSGG